MYEKMKVRQVMKNTDGIRLLILDFDGTLADTMYGIMDGVNMAMDKFGMPRHTYDEIVSYVGNGSRDLIRRSLPEKYADNKELLDEVVKYYDSSCYPVTYKNRTECYAGMLDTLELLKKRGYTLAVLSNKRDIFIQPMVKEMLPEGLLSIAMGQTDLPKKPDPTAPLTIAKQLGFEPFETAFIGDSDTDMLTGRNAKMLAVGCSWGYRPREVLAEAGADVIIDAPTELADIFSEF